MRSSFNNITVKSQHQYQAEKHATYIYLRRVHCNMSVTNSVSFKCNTMQPHKCTNFNNSFTVAFSNE